MANNYVQFSEVIDKLTDEEQAWLKEVLEFEPADLHGDDPEGLRAFEELTVRLGIDLSPSDWWPDFQYEICNESDASTSLWLYSEESGNIDNVAKLVSAFLRKFRPTEYFKLTWACTCSKPRIGEFSGGGMFVTANGVEYINPDSELDNLEKVFRVSRGQGSKV